MISPTSLLLAVHWKNLPKTFYLIYSSTTCYRQPRFSPNIQRFAGTLNGEKRKSVAFEGLVRYHSFTLRRWIIQFSGIFTSMSYPKTKTHNVWRNESAGWWKISLKAHGLGGFWATSESPYAQDAANTKKFLSSWHEELNGYLTLCNMTPKAFNRATRPILFCAIILLLIQIY